MLGLTGMRTVAISTASSPATRLYTEMVRPAHSFMAMCRATCAFNPEEHPWPCSLAAANRLTWPKSPGCVQWG